jgi:hypothetical protein
VVKGAGNKPPVVLHRTDCAIALSGAEAALETVLLSVVPPEVLVASRVVAHLGNDAVQREDTLKQVALTKQHQVTVNCTHATAHPQQPLSLAADLYEVPSGLARSPTFLETLRLEGTFEFVHSAPHVVLHGLQRPAVVGGHHPL